MGFEFVVLGLAQTEGPASACLARPLDWLLSPAEVNSYIIVLEEYFNLMIKFENIMLAK